MSPGIQSVALTGLALACAALLAPGWSGTAEPNDSELVSTALYHRDHNHLWNRLHSALLIRVGPHGRAYGEDRLEPLLWAESTHLLSGKSADRAVSVLEEFVHKKGETLIDDSLKRAMLQRDLWLVFNWLAQDREAIDKNPARRRLAVPLAKVVGRLALTPEQIAKLPDNYAAAVASNRFADRFDPDKPERSYLPPDLFKPDGPWVCIGRTEGRTAPLHLQSGSNGFTNSAFIVFLKFPAGRDATLDFLKRLAEFDKPLYLSNSDEKTRRFVASLPNPALPQWPKGAEVALVRRAMLIDSKGRVVASPLTESVQLRVMRADTPAMTANTVKELFQRGAPDAQAFAEFQLRRTALFAGEAGGLRDVSGQRDFKTGFNSHTWDEFEVERSGPFPERAQPFPNNRTSCLPCHRYPGVYSFNSFHGDFPFTVRRELNDESKDAYVPKSHSLAAMPVSEVERAAVKWKKNRQAWNALQKLLPD